MSAGRGTTVLGLILRSEDEGEADRRILLLTSERGLVWVTAKNARVSKRRFPGRLEPFGEGRMELVRYRRTEYLQGVEPLSSPGRIPGDLGRFYLACYAAEVVGAALVVEVPAPETYSLVSELFRDLATAPSLDDHLARAVFEAHLLGELGLLPTHPGCHDCGAGIGSGDAALWFDASTGSWICLRHGGGPGPGRARIDLPAWEAMEVLCQHTFPLEQGPRVAGWPPDPEVLRPVNRLTALVVLHQIPGRFRSAALLNAHQARRFGGRDPSAPGFS